MRILIDYLAPVFLPSLLWILWLSWRQRRAIRRGRIPPAWNTVPWVWLLVAGGLLTLVIAFGGVLEGKRSVGHYSPAYVDRNGRLVPGQVR